MHTRNVNVKTAAQESTERWGANTNDLTFDQGIDLFAWVVRATQGEPKSSDFNPPAEAIEIPFFYEDAPDYFSIWFIQGYPIAAAIPLESYFRINTTFINQIRGRA